MKDIGIGIAWAGFWLGLGLYNFQGCHHDIVEVHDLLHGVQQERIK